MEEYGGDVDFSSVFGGSEVNSPDSVGPSTDLSTSDIEYYTGGGDTVWDSGSDIVAHGEVQETGMIQARMTSSNPDLGAESEKPSQGVAYLAGNILTALQNVGKIVQSGADNASMVIRGVRQVQASATTPTVVATPAATPASSLLSSLSVGGISGMQLAIIGGLGFLAYRSLR